MLWFIDVMCGVVEVVVGVDESLCEVILKCWVFEVGFYCVGIVCLVLLNNVGVFECWIDCGQYVGMVYME